MKLIKYAADTGLNYHEFEAENDNEAALMYPDALIWRLDGVEMDCDCFGGIQ